MKKLSEITMLNTTFNINVKNDPDLFPTNCTIGKFTKQTSAERYKTMLMHKEYGHKKLPYARSDIVILNEDDAKNIDDPMNLKYQQEWIVPDYIFEFGTEKAAGSDGVLEEHLENDLIKTERSRIKGYVIHIHRNICRSKSQTKRSEENNKKIKIYETAIKNVLIKRKGQTNDRKKVKILIFLIAIGNAGKRISRSGKIRIFNCNTYKFNGIDNDLVLNRIKELLQNEEYY
jgi:hypothetical protein